MFLYASRGLSLAYYELRGAGAKLRGGVGGLGLRLQEPLELVLFFPLLVEVGDPALRASRLVFLFQPPKLPLCTRCAL